MSWTKTPHPGEYYYSTPELRPKAFKCRIFDDAGIIKVEIPADGQNQIRVILLSEAHESIEYMEASEFIAEYGEAPQEVFAFQQETYEEYDFEVEKDIQ